ncbi:nucleotide disphospho-sugar-binding domain-containing protein [Rothia mucilaginosa]|uniref:glycosyltransferase n=1 Tax=Rothia mucilaginosa TaxID=43675 RepID=UPI0028EE9147|nr:nucleotide disphospho-sugar-binding domain-containing protein [Rothia mucilaginosa]
MSRILFSPESFNMGETTRCIEMARAARERGHTVLFHVYSPKYIGLLESAELPVHLREPIMSDAEAEQIMALDQGRGVRHPFTTDMVRRRVAAELAAIRDFNADAVVIGSNLTMLLSARIAGVPIFYARPYAYSSTYFSKKPVGGELAAPCWLRAVARVFSYKPASFTRVAREHGLRLPRRTVDMLSADVNLICSLFTQLRGDSLVEPDVGVGPIYYRAPGELPQIVRVPRKRPLIYVGMGSSGSADILAQVLQQLSAAPVDVLVGGGVQLSDTSMLGSNIHFAGTVPGTIPAHLLAGHIDASITHGGEGTVQTACLAGVPFAGIAMQAEQSWNIEECVRYGNALRFTKNDVRRGNVRDILDRLLSDEGMRAKARQLGEAMRTMDGAALAVEKIEDYLRAPR